MVLLDTSVVVDFLRGRSPLIRVRLDDARHAGRRIAVSSVTVFELWYGAFKGAYAEENTLRLRRLFAGDVEVIAFDERDAEGAGALRTYLERVGPP